MNHEWRAVERIIERAFQVIYPNAKLANLVEVIRKTYNIGGTACVKSQIELDQRCCDRGKSYGAKPQTRKILVSRFKPKRIQNRPLQFTSRPAQNWPRFNLLIEDLRKARDETFLDLR